MSSGPVRIQRRRTRGWRMPPGTVVVSRPSRWGNPYAVTMYGRTLAVELFAAYLQGKPELLAAVRRELRGRNLACWCALDQPCHADVLLRVANEEVP